MPRTPDRFPGSSDDEGVDLEPNGLATVVGSIRYNGARFSFMDSTGEFDPRTGGASDVRMEPSIGSNVTVQSTEVYLNRCATIEAGIEVRVLAGGEVFII